MYAASGKAYFCITQYDYDMNNFTYFRKLKEIQISIIVHGLETALLLLQNCMLSN